MFYKTEMYVGSIMQDSVQGKFNAFYACESYILHFTYIAYVHLRKNKKQLKIKKLLHRQEMYSIFMLSSNYLFHFAMLNFVGK